MEYNVLNGNSVFENVLKDIVRNELSSSEIIDLHNIINDMNDRTILNMCDFNVLFGGCTPLEIIDKIDPDNFCTTDDYFVASIYGCYSGNTNEDFDVIDYKELADYLYLNRYCNNILEKHCDTIYNEFLDYVDDFCTENNINADFLVYVQDNVYNETYEEDWENLIIDLIEDYSKVKEENEETI